MSEIAKLSPQIVWRIFDEITRVPRPSKKEEKIIAYLVDFAQKHNLDYKTDEVGNVAIYRPAAESMKNRPVVVLQSHMDMVCEKNSDVDFDFDSDPIKVRIVDGWVMATGTTLGADDGIGMAAALAILIDRELELPRIEALFTVDEETGLTGAFNLADDMLTGRYLINLDSEDEGEIFIGCAGGVDTLATFTYRPEPAPAGYTFFRMDIRGLKGGHSGDDIEKGRGNSNKLTVRLLWQAAREHGLRLSHIDGGNLRNAIPREAYSIFAIPDAEVAKFNALFEKFSCEVREQYRLTEPDMEVSLREVQPSPTVLDEASQGRLLDAVQGLPNGVLAMSFAMPDILEPRVGEA